MYDRRVAGRELEFEASGGLLQASLVMRDRETDSWWSIMTADAIGGELENTPLVELPWGRKAMWKDWVAKHPQTVVLSVNGEEHLNNNPYDNYFESDDTFRGLRVKDKRLGAKEPVYTFRLQDDPYAAPHSSFQGGRLFKIPGDSATTLMLYRERGISFFASNEAYLVDAPASADPREVLTKIRDGRLSSQPLGGFDTFWYSWVTVNPNSKLLR